jgi:dTDP-glucose pyrophosphorylase/predicted transcriptional regulator
MCSDELDGGVVVASETSLETVLRCLQNNVHKLCIVLDDSRRICGTITDGDCRRGLLRGLDLQSQAHQFMNKQFVVVDETFSSDQILSLMKSNGIDQVPIVDSDRIFVSVVSRYSLARDVVPRANPVLILAGGKGMRLRPLTDYVPKPMLSINGCPILEQLIDRLVKAGFSDIFISINYLGHLIESHFGDGSKFSCSIRYLKEDTELGTGGPLRLMGKVEEPILALNGDLVTSVDYQAVVDLHTVNQYDLTVSVHTYAVEIPFGVVELNNSGEVLSLKEKPTYSFPINAGLYVINPQLLQHIPAGEFFPITSLVNDVLKRGGRVGGFPIHESWNDIGVLSQYFSMLKQE